METRSIALAGLGLTALVVVGFVALGVVMKLSGYPANPDHVRWNPMALWLRENGMWLLSAPVQWTLLASLSVTMQKQWVRPQMLVLLAGALVDAIASCFVYSATFPYTPPIINKVKGDYR